MRSRSPLFLLLLLLLPSDIYAWGPTGHRVVGAIAEQHLTPKARRAIQQLLGDTSLAMASTWMDEVRSDHRYDDTHDWHWVTIPDGGTYASSAKNPNGDLIEAIGRMEDILRSDTASVPQRREALKFLVHLIGDLHQPLHVGRGDDKGGNTVQVQWMGHGSNLHRVWDSEMIDQEVLSYTELAAALDHVGKQRCRAIQMGRPADWAMEDIALRDRIYDLGTDNSIGYGYLYRNWPVVQERLLKAGVRLAGILNAVFR
ncbi:MAG: S1/P1 nuclease [Flavobacteriales bacterium]|nr:S1/P1 nuclease [Flavobacteriales bacterium]MCB9194505.1 S1/P1 nuclease [Flavobacteriales bacterium]